MSCSFTSLGGVVARVIACANGGNPLECPKIIELKFRYVYPSRSNSPYPLSI